MRLMERLRQRRAAERGTSLRLLPGIRTLPPRRTTAGLLAAYREMPWLRAAAGKIASSVAAVAWSVSQGSAEGLRPLPDHPLARLLDAGTGLREDGVPGLTGLQVRKVTCLHLDLVGEAFWLLDRNQADMPIAILPLSPAWVRDVARPGQPLFALSLPGGQQLEVPARDVVMFRDLDPERPYERGSGVAQALADELLADEMAAKYIGAFLANRARPDLIVAGSAEQPLSREEAERLEVAWSGKFGGPDRGGKPFFSSGPLSVTEVGQSFRDSQMQELRAFERDTIVSVFGLPPEKLGILENSNRSTIEAADLFFAKEVLLPRLRFLRETIQQRLVPEFDQRLVVSFDNPVESDRGFLLQVIQAAPQYFSAAEIRALAGLPPAAPAAIAEEEE